MMMKLYTVTCDGADDDGGGGGGFSLTRNAVRHTHTQWEGADVKEKKK